MINKINSEGWNSRHTNIALAYILVMVFGVLVVFNIQAVHPIWFIITIGIAIWYFYTLYYCNKKWLTISDKKFEKRLFWQSLFYRVSASIVLILVAQITWGQPHYVGAVDAISYHREALIIADLLRGFNFNEAYLTAISFTGSIDNSGPPLLIGFIYSIFGKYYFIGTIFYAVLGSLSVVYLYRIATNIWGDEIGKLTGIMFMHFPLALFYSVVFLKEGIVVFLVLLIVCLVTKSINGNKLTLSNFVVIIFALVSLFFFRTAVGALLALLVPAAFMINRYRGSSLKASLVGLSVAFLFGYFMYTLGEYEFFLNRLYSGETVGDQRTAYLGIEDVEAFSFSLRDIALAPIYLIVSIIAPFAGMVEVGTRLDTGHDHNYYNIPGTIIWNALAYFSLIGIYYSVKEKLFNSFMVWAFTGGYIYILLVTVLFTRDRFAFIGMPLMLALSAVGVYRSRNKLYWYIYLTGLIVMTIVWNTLRLNVRGG